MKNITFINCTTNYPFNFSANNSKIGLLAKGIISADKDCSVTIINLSFGKVPLCENDKDSFHENIRVITYKNKGNKLFMLIKNSIKICQYIISNKFDTRSLIFCGGHFLIHFIHLIVGKLNGYKIGYIYQEWHRGFNESLIRQINNYLMDTLFPKMVDYVLPISEFLIEKTKPYNKTYFKLPIIGDFNVKKISTYKPTKNNYFVYCASIAYYNVAILIIDAFSNFLKSQKEDYSLCLVLYGDKIKINQLINYIEKNNLKNNVIILSSLSDEDLFACYCNALALLIPLNPNIVTEKARFSQKIAEYLSSKRAIITTPVGEINHYFKDKENIIITNYSVKGFCEALEYTCENIKETQEIGLRGYDFGKKNFSYDIVSKDFLHFLKVLYS